MTGPDNEAVVIVDIGGQLNFLCRHSHGSRYNWSAYRTKIEGPLSYDKSLQPDNFTDLGQAKIFIQLYGSKVKYSRATKWLVFNGSKWEESEEKARGLVHDLLIQQMQDAQNKLRSALESDRSAAEYAKDYLKANARYQNTQRIAATLTEAAPAATIDVELLDKDPYLLNTPAGMIDLRTGLMHEHDPYEYCTKITACSPSDEGADEWKTFLNQITGGDQDLQNYLQLCMGMCAIGIVQQEKLLIFNGGGGNGKSTFVNSQVHALGDYAGHLSAEALTTGSRKNTSPEFAELRGKRLIVAAELEEGNRLDTSVVKKLCSTDMIQAEKKYKDPFSFKPSHTVILFTNHLPKVGTNDRGTWDRLVVVPFKARFRNTDNEIFNYADVLYERAGGAILSWIIEGARLFIEGKYRLQPPACVRDAIEEYQQDNDWLSAFITSCCDVKPDNMESAGTLYRKYSEYCDRNREYKRSAADFKAAMLDRGFFWRKTMQGAMYYGISSQEDQRWDPFN